MRAGNSKIYLSGRRGYRGESKQRFSFCREFGNTAGKLRVKTWPTDNSYEVVAHKAMHYELRDKREERHLAGVANR